MKYTGTLTVTTHQVGATVYFIEEDLPQEATVVETQNTVYKDANDATVEVIEYKLSGKGNKWYPASEIYASVAAMKTAFGTLADAL